MSEATFPHHGRQSCAACFPHIGAVWGHTVRTVEGWTLEHNPLHWGAANPRFLVLGFSKGSRQSVSLLTTPVDDIPYRGFRPKLTQALQVLGLLAEGDRVENHIRAAEPDWGFASMSRCSISAVDPATGASRKSGDVISRLASGGVGADWFGTCVRQHLGVLPSRLQVVVLLSNDDRYVDFCFDRLRALHPGLRRLNGVSYTDGRVMWVHVVHVGGPGANHTDDWLKGAPGKQGDKRRMGVEAVASALHGNPVSPARGLPAPVITGSVLPAMQAPPPARSYRGVPREVSASVLRDVVRETLRAHPALRPHPDRPEGTKYIHAYLSRNGRVVAHEVGNTGRQPIWVPQEDCRIDLVLDIPHEVRAAGTPRNSNLHRFAELKDTAVYRFLPRTQEDVRRIIEAVCPA